MTLHKNTPNHPNESWLGLITQITNPIGIDYGDASHNKLVSIGDCKTFRNAFVCKV